MQEVAGVGFSELLNIVVILATLFMLRQILRERARPDVADSRGDLSWRQARDTVLEALSPMGFTLVDEDVDATRFRLERASQSISVSWNARHREVAARVARTDAVVDDSALVTARMPRSGKADQEIAHLVGQLQSMLRRLPDEGRRQGTT
ncbi:MAG: hypothetical protein HYV19_09875 [Gemmatimonadetes bacterium]|nr:hypothetical protein [Gemmatimonadota bacterium]